MRSSILVLSITLRGSALVADVIHGNLGPGDAYDDGGSDSGFFLGNSGSDLWEHAEFFVPSRSLVLADIEIAIGYVHGHRDVLVEIVESDADGRPGMLVEAFRLMASKPFDSGGGLEGAPSVLEPVLDCGSRYWIVARSADPVNSLARWHSNSVEDRGPTAIRQDGGPWSTDGESIRGAFRITGSPPAFETPCPGPASLLATGKAVDSSSPLDGVAELAGPAIVTIDLELNASDRDPLRIREERGIIEFDMTRFAGSWLQSAVLELEVSGPAPGEVRIFAYGGDGMVTRADYEETSDLAAVTVLSVGSESIDVTTSVQALLHAGQEVAGFLIALTSEDQRIFIHDAGFAPEPRLFIEPRPPRVFLRADCSANGVVGITDAVITLSFLFLGEDEPTCEDACDSDDNGILDISDAIVTLGVLFLGTGTIPPPAIECGVDPVRDGLDCDAFERCP